MAYKPSPRFERGLCIPALGGFGPSLAADLHMYMVTSMLALRKFSGRLFITLNMTRLHVPVAATDVPMTTLAVWGAGQRAANGRPLVDIVWRGCVERLEDLAMLSF